MPWFPVAADIPLAGWWILAAISVVTHLVYVPIWIASGLAEKIFFILYPVFGFVGDVFVSVQFDSSEELFWAGYTWIMLAPTLMLIGHARELAEAERIQKKQGGKLQNYVPRKVKNWIRGQTVAVLLLGAWLIFTT